MRKSKFSESKIVSLLKEAEAGRKVSDICREHGISNNTFYQWRSKFGGMEASDIRRLKELQEENEKLKRMYADMALENRAIKDLLGIPEKRGRLNFKAVTASLGGRRIGQQSWSLDREVLHSRRSFSARLVSARSCRKAV
jgi:putative transposase